MAARIRHLAICSNEPQRLGRFYSGLFGMDLTDPSGGAANLSDGYIGMNVNPRRPGRQAGFDHFGIEVEDVEGTLERLRDLHPECDYLQRPGNRSFAGISVHDPGGQVFDLSKPREARRNVYTKDGSQQHASHVCHFTLRTLNPPKLAAFYRDVFEFREEARGEADPCFYLSDGTVTMVVAPWKLADYAGTGIERPALDHIGFAVGDLGRFQDTLAEMAEEEPDLAPLPFPATSEGEARQRLLSGCRYGQAQLADPDGVLLDVSEA